uniref:Uncharacterized protein n=1 Tax=Meloidogyne incognita TaxID=6306 RepID=A0A914KX68_MELIC
MRFQSDFDGNVGHNKRYSSASRLTKGTQSDEIVYNATGTDPLKAPERGTQTDKEYLLWNRSAANSLRISSNLVDLLLNELDNISAELPLFKVYERLVWGNDFEKEQKRRIFLQLLRETELPKTEGLSSTCQPFAIRCGLGSRIAVLFAEPEHDSHCAEHVGHLLLNLRRKQNSWIQLPTCPSDAIFGRHGEIVYHPSEITTLCLAAENAFKKHYKEESCVRQLLRCLEILIVGLYNGEFLLLSALEGNVGKVLWNGGGPTAGLHSRAITQFHWLDEHKGMLISVGLDGKVIKSRLEPNNQLALLESIQITLSDLPKHLYRESTNRSVGLFGVSIFKKWENKQQLWIATETGVLIQLEEKLNKINKHYSKMKIFEKEQQNNLFLLILERRIFICKTLDGRILQRIEFEEDGHFNNNSQVEKLLPVGFSRCEISILTNTNLFFILSTDQHNQKIMLKENLINELLFVIF